MTPDDLRNTIRSNLERSDLKGGDIRLQVDPRIGMRLAVIDEGFSDLPQAERRDIVLNGLEDIDFEWVELVTPEESKWTGPLWPDGYTRSPFWPEILQASEQSKAGASGLEFPLELDIDLPLPIVSTFYSLRGGVGRSTALAYTSLVLANRNLKVVCVDMDLEAPALHSLFGVEKRVEPGNGVVDLLFRIDQGEVPDCGESLVRIDEARDLYLLPAGVPSADYARKLAFLDFGAWYREERNPLRLFFQSLRTELPFVPDVLLFDARTGISPLAAPLLFDLADLAVVVFFPHPQSRAGTAELVKGLLATRTWRSLEGKSLAPEPRFIVSPVPASKSREIVDRYEHRALEWIAGWLDNTSEHSWESGVEGDISIFLPYREDVATSDQIYRDEEVWRRYVPVADWIDQLVPSASEERIASTLSISKNSILEELRFGAGTAEQQKELTEVFVRTESAEAAISDDTALVIGRKGTGKTAIFRYLKETDDRAIAVHSPASLRPRHQLSADGFASVERILELNQGVEWRHFWAFYCGVAFTIRHDLGLSFTSVSDGQSSSVPPTLPSTERETLGLFSSLVELPDFQLLVREWLEDLDSEGQRSILLMDGLDTGFGNSEAERKRRGHALVGLFTFWTDHAEVLKNMRLKIVLREDIWRELNFENKSHFFGRTASLRWTDQDEFLKVALKQALRADRLRQYLRQEIPRARLDLDDVDRWSQKESRDVWHVLVGERMKGGRAAFTRNWVWKRLADGNDDHSPRHLLQLFHSATLFERSEHPDNPHEKSVIRPKALVESLSAVSNEALGAIREEFNELGLLLERLKEIGTTPFQASELERAKGLRIGLATEVGLLEIYEKSGDGEEVERYRVPEIYRLALDMGRRGQA